MAFRTSQLKAGTKHLVIDGHEDETWCGRLVVEDGKETYCVATVATPQGVCRACLAAHEALAGRSFDTVWWALFQEHENVLRRLKDDTAVVAVVTTPIEAADHNTLARIFVKGEPEPDTKRAYARHMITVAEGRNYITRKS